MDTAEIVEDIWRKAQEFMHLSGTYMDDAHIGKADDLYLFQTIVESKVSRTYICPDDHACQCGAGIRVTEFKRKVLLEFKGTHDKHSHRLRIMHAPRCAPGVGGFKTYTSDSASDGSGNLAIMDRIRDAIPYSPVLEELRRKGSAECIYRRNLNGISDSDSNPDTSPEPKKSVRRNGAAYSGPAYVFPSSQDEPEVEYATEYYSESPVRPSLSPATKKRQHDEREAEMDAMSSMSESELQAQVQAIMDARERKKQEETRKFLEYRRSLKGE